MRVRPTIRHDLLDGILSDPTAPGAYKEALQLFIEEFSRLVLGRQLLGIGRNTTDELELYLFESSDDLDEPLADLLAATIDAARNLDSAYVGAGQDRFAWHYFVPWLEALEGWLGHDDRNEALLENARELRKLVGG